MKERPILFSGPMVKAILEGRKTMTRRVVKPQPTRYLPIPDGRWQHEETGVLWDGPKCPYGVPGDRLWVRETFCIESSGGYDLPGIPIDRPCHDIMEDHDIVDREVPHYRATEPTVELCYEDADPSRPNCPLCELGDPHCHWKPSIHMPRWASRITLEIVSVRVERLKEITWQDIIHEGTPQARSSSMYSYRDQDAGFAQSKTAFCNLWNSINGKTHPWESNPFCWVIEFKRIAGEEGKDVPTL